ncbi:hypothetical protein [Actinomadura sp. DC4]|nr:hypothetical protein [Actinomadura sp. DC4]MDN3356035.1 hypothetical protein [Actinomadura sp. DC4]
MNALLAVFHDLPAAVGSALHDLPAAVGDTVRDLTDWACGADTPKENR